MTTKKINKISDEEVEIVKTASDEDKILGAQDETIKEKIINYENPSILYRVTNLQLKNNPIIIPGNLIEGFIGINNKTARISLQSGIKTVITKDTNKDDIYKIEVIE